MGDICAYLALGNQVISVELKRACSGYYPQVFVFTPKQEIYQQDSERPHTFAGSDGYSSTIGGNLSAIRLSGG